MIKILVEKTDNGGCGKYRCVDPHQYLSNLYKNEYQVIIKENIDYQNINFLKEFDAIFIHRLPKTTLNKIPEAICNIKNLGIKLILDYDDYLDVDISHPMYQQYRLFKIPQLQIEIIKIADMVITPTHILQNYLKQFNKKTYVIPNGIDPNEEQFQIRKEKSDRLRVGWMGGSSHIEDIKLLSSISNTIQNTNTKLYLGGFNVRDKKNIIDSNGNKQEVPLEPHEFIYQRYEDILTNNHSIISKEYSELLMEQNEIKENEIKEKYKDEVYERIWTKDINNYATGYNLFDVSLAPLKDNKFNLYKSQLKIIESGFFHMPIIASDYGPYQIDVINAYDRGNNIKSKGNALLVDPNRNHKMWPKYIKLLNNNPNLVEDLGEKLYETVKDKYNLINITKIRHQIYQTLYDN